jgi:hypothetical protein
MATVCWVRSAQLFQSNCEEADVTYIYGQSPLPGSVAGLYGRASWRAAKIYRTDQAYLSPGRQRLPVASLEKLPNSKAPSSGCMQLGRKVTLSPTRFFDWRFKPDTQG